MKPDKVKQLDNKVFTQYVYKKGKRCGCIVVVEVDGIVKVGWSKYACSKEDKSFSKKQGRAMAIGRAIHPKMWDVQKLPTLIKHNLFPVIAQARKYFPDKEITGWF